MSRNKHLKINTAAGLRRISKPEALKGRASHIGNVITLIQQLSLDVRPRQPISRAASPRRGGLGEGDTQCGSCRKEMGGREHVDSTMGCSPRHPIDSADHTNPMCSHSTANPSYELTITYIPQLFDWVFRPCCPSTSFRNSRRYEELFWSSPSAISHSIFSAIIGPGMTSSTSISLIELRIRRNLNLHYPPQLDFSMKGDHFFKALVEVGRQPFL